MIIVTDNGPIEVLEEVEARTPVRPGLEITWTGADGAPWNLCRGPVTLMSGARGFGLPTPQHWRRENLSHGAMHAGLRFPPREFFLPVRIRHQSILEQERAFFAGLDPRACGRLRVTTPDAQWRELELRYDDGAEGEYDVDPLVRRHTASGMRMTAEDPFWLGEPVVAEFPYPTDTPAFFTGPPFRLAPSEVLGRSSLTNPGDVDAYAVWRIQGPCTGFSVGIGDQVVTMTRTMTAAGYVEIDTNPAAKTIRSQTGTNLWSQAAEVSMAPLPPGEVEVTTAVLGAAAGTSVTVSFTPRYFRAW